MTRRLPQYHRSVNRRMSEVQIGQVDGTSSDTSHHHHDGIGLECTPYQHSQRCTCNEQSVDQSRDDEGLRPQHAHALMPAGDVSNAAWGPPHHPTPAYSGCQYGGFGSSDPLSICTAASTPFSAPQLPFRPFGGIQPQILGGSTPLDIRSHADTFSHGYPQHPTYLMQDINTQTSPSDAPPFGSPSPDDSSDGTASPPTPTGTSAGRQEYAPHRSLRDNEPKITFPDLELDHDLRCNNEIVTPNIHASIERNIFYHDKQWTCYRRNYIFLQCHYSLTPCIPGAPLYVDMGGKDGKKMVQALGVSLSATLEGNKDGKGVGLVQHTPKRDKGPQSDVGVEKLGPSPPGPDVPPYHGSTAANGPHLPLQALDCDNTTSMPPSGQHTFERIQFKQATANNGRRRAAQQFYHLSVELHADIRKDAKASPKWVRIAHRVSEPMVVRGRSPGHYKQDKGSPSSGSNGGGSFGGGFGPSSSFAFHGNSSSSSHGHVSGFHPQGHHTVAGGSSHGNFHSHRYIATPSMTPISHSSAATPTKSYIKQRHDSMTSVEDAFAFDHDPGYRLFPSSAYDNPGSSSQRPAIKVESNISTVNSPFFSPAEYSNTWHMPSCGRLSNIDTSPPFYPNVGASF